MRARVLVALETKFAALIHLDSSLVLLTPNNRPEATFSWLAI